jgi:uncharacterized protein (TIGR02757 family)
MKLNNEELYDFLEHYHDKYNRPDFIENDPICIPHLFTKKEDIEISGFLAATIAWGKREMIIKNAKNIIERMDNSPFDFIINYSTNDLKSVGGFVHRTFNSIDLSYFFKSLKNIYLNHKGLENVLNIESSETNTLNTLSKFNSIFFELDDYPLRTKKHVSNPLKGSAAKRLNMYYRWMTRNDDRGVDFGIWNNKSSQLICPLDVHTGNISRKIGLLSRKQNDWKAALELTNNLKKFDPVDPVKYDFSLFGAGINTDI